MLLVQIFRSPKPRLTNIFYYVTLTQLQKKQHGKFSLLPDNCVLNVIMRNVKTMDIRSLILYLQVQHSWHDDILVFFISKFCKGQCYRHFEKLTFQ